MFTIDPKITDLHVKEKNLYKALFSMNIHKVATPEMMLEDARTYVLFFRETKEKLSAYIALHLLLTNRRLYYSYSDNPFLDEKMDAVEEEAFAFAESLGAMLDKIDFTKLSDSEQARWIDEQDIFSQKQTSEAQPVPHQSAQIQPAAPATQPASTPAQPEPQALPTPLTRHDEQAPAPPSQQPSHAPQKPALASPLPPTPPVEQETPAPQPAQPLHTVQTSTPVPPAPPTPKTQRPTPAHHPVPPQPPETAPRQTPSPQQTALPARQPKPQQRQAPAKQQEIMQEAIKAGIAKPPKQTQNQEAQSVICSVRRDREALARLLTSF